MILLLINAEIPAKFRLLIDHAHPEQVRLHAALILSTVDKELVADFEENFWNFQENISLIDIIGKV